MHVTMTRRYSSSQLSPMTKATSIQILCIYFLMINHHDVIAFVSPSSRRPHQPSLSYGQQQRDSMTFSPHSSPQPNAFTTNSRGEIALLARRGKSGGSNKGGGTGK